MLPTVWESVAVNVSKRYRAHLKQFPLILPRLLILPVLPRVVSLSALSKQFSFQCYNLLFRQKIGGGVLLELSTGPDSHCLCPLLQPIIVIHVSHGGNGAESRSHDWKIYSLVWEAR